MYKISVFAINLAPIVGFSDLIGPEERGKIKQLLLASDIDLAIFKTECHNEIDPTSYCPTRMNKYPSYVTKECRPQVCTHSCSVVVLIRFPLTVFYT